ncbi:uncharacterized protein LOC125233240 isoform X8 [Leguminivora glycinivorella]|uniref:uncharacterized protein LOC125233240 isoform X8 n=1 Tax=Leguminivora glycinivorella TaxID=1035111 RepID=UPI00200E305B|nr:uncharacterized protein LOC125233240 isoform X8 [Leguminivora glycinivorella]
MYTVTGNIPYVNAYLKGHLDATQLKLADPKFDVSQDVDIIFGLDILNYIYTGSKILTNIPGVEAYGTCFGHVLMGALWKHPADISTKQLRGTSVEDYGVHATRLEEVLEKFWKVEQPPEDPVEHPEHVECERRHQFVFTADIRMMFRQTWIHPDDRRYQLILWREDPSQDLQVYELNTNTYGLRSSPFVAIRTLIQLANDWQAQHPGSPAADVVRRQVYVDDVLAGAESIAEAQQLKSELTDLMSSAGYELRKWSSNCRELLQDLPQEYCEIPHHFDAEDKSLIKVLGIQWNPINDTMSYQINVPLGQAITKRSVLSTIARLYDPCGYCAPIVYRFKLFMQSLFSDGMTWDEPLTEVQESQWNEMVQDLNHLSHLQISRCVALPGSVSYSLHGFGDASEMGYGACVYLRTADAAGNVMVPRQCI